jgi:hypothetical protein
VAYTDSTVSDKLPHVEKIVDWRGGLFRTGIIMGELGRVSADEKRRQFFQFIFNLRRDLYKKSLLQLKKLVEDCEMERDLMKFA